MIFFYFFYFYNKNKRKEVIINNHSKKEKIDSLLINFHNQWKTTFEVKPWDHILLDI